MNGRMNNAVRVQHITGEIIRTIHYEKANIMQYNFMIGELLLLLKGHSRSHVRRYALLAFQTKTVIVVRVIR